ncbi:MAG: hypothetical protein K6G23_01160 [Lachnospiraceae bacterium]|nr:hypothetical protein [Lachnospiraceae bacterium]
MKKWIAAALAAVLVIVGVVGYETTMTTEAGYGTGGATYVYNAVDDISFLSISTPASSILTYSGLTWQQMEEDIGVRLNLSNTTPGSAGQIALTAKAAEAGGTVLRYFDADLEKYLDGWTQDIETTYSELRIALGLPTGLSQSLDYAIVTYNEDGSTSLLGDLDTNPATVTFDTKSFSTWALVSGPKGQFDKYRVASATSLTAYDQGVYLTSIPSSVGIEIGTAYIYAAAILSDEMTSNAAFGSSNVCISLKDSTPGIYAKNAIDQVALTAGAKKINYVDTVVSTTNGTVTKTNQKVRFAVDVPYSFPAYGEYAVVVLNADGSASLIKDLDSVQSLVTFDTDQFRMFAIIWAPDLNV